MVNTKAERQSSAVLSTETFTAEFPIPDGTRLARAIFEGIPKVDADGEYAMFWVSDKPTPAAGYMFPTDAGVIAWDSKDFKVTTNGINYAWTAHGRSRRMVMELFGLETNNENNKLYAGIYNASGSIAYVSITIQYYKNKKLQEKSVKIWKL